MQADEHRLEAREYLRGPRSIGGREQRFHPQGVLADRFGGVAFSSMAEEEDIGVSGGLLYERIAELDPPFHPFITVLVVAEQAVLDVGAGYRLKSHYAPVVEGT